MNDRDFDVVLRADDPEFLQKFRKALGLKEGDYLDIVGPQFERTDGVVASIPSDSWEQLRTLSPETLKALGCGQWDGPDKDGNVLMLFPKEWYAHIPDGYLVWCIDGESERFRKGVTDDDYRFGCLAYGVLVKSRMAQERQG